MVKLVLVAVSVIVSVAMAFPAENSEGLRGEFIPVRIVRSADPGPAPHHYYRKRVGYGPGYGGGYGGGHGGGYGGGYGGGHGGGYGGGHGGGYEGGYDHDNFGHGGHGPGYNQGGGYNNYRPHGGSNANAQSSASAGAINTPFGSASYASANSAANSGGGFYRK